MAELACAKAELDMAGEEMWRFCASKGRHRKTISPWRLLRPAGILLGLVIVLATALPLSNLPLSKDQEGASSALASTLPTFAWNS